jgi:hypothetical protein
LARRQIIKVPVMPEGLEAWMGRFEERVDTLIKQQDESEKASQSHRAALRETIATMSSSIQACNSKIETCTTQIGELKPQVADFTLMKAEARGAAKLAKVLWLAASAAGGALAAMGVEFFRSR